MEKPHVFLGLNENATPDEIKKAYKLYAKKLHPDKHDGDPFFEEMFKRVSNAYELLIDPSKKKKQYTYNSDPGLSENEKLRFELKIAKLEAEVDMAWRAVKDAKSDTAKIKENSEVITREKEELKRELYSAHSAAAEKQKEFDALKSSSSIKRGCIRNVFLLIGIFLGFLLIAALISGILSQE